MKMNTTIAAIIAAAAALSAMASPAQAQTDALNVWIKSVSKQVSANMRIPHSGNGSYGGYGVASATVRRTPDGRAELVKMDCKNRSVARVARIAIARLRKLPPLPSGFDGAAIRMNLLLGDPGDSRGYYAQLDRLTAQADAQNRMLAARVTGEQFALNKVP